MKAIFSDEGGDFPGSDGRDVDAEVGRLGDCDGFAGRGAHGVAVHEPDGGAGVEEDGVWHGSVLCFPGFAGGSGEVDVWREFDCAAQCAPEFCVGLWDGDDLGDGAVVFCEEDAAAFAAGDVVD